MSLPVGWVVAGIAAITASLVLLYKWAYNNSIKGQIEQTSNALADVQDNISATKSSLEELKNSQDKLSELEEGFNGLVKGTDAWNQKLLESNGVKGLSFIPIRIRGSKLQYFAFVEAQVDSICEYDSDGDRIYGTFQIDFTSWNGE